jgi:signal transduction histidine kinase
MSTTDFFKSLKGKLAVYFALSIVLSLLLSGLLSVGLVQRYLRQRTISDLEAQAQTISGRIESEGLPQQRYLSDLERVQGVRVDIVPRQVDSVPPLLQRGSRGEVARLFRSQLSFLDWQALEQGQTQISETMLPGEDREVVAAAHGFRIEDELAGAVVASRAVSSLAPWRPLAMEFLIAALIALAISLFFAFLLARRLSRPLHEITKAATAVADGDFSRRITVTTEDEIGRLADAFRHMTAEVERSREQQRQFFMNVSHELKTPLTAITGHVQALRDGVARNPEAVTASLEVISEEAGRLNRLIEDLLSLARFDASQFELRSSSFSLDEVLVSAADGFSRQARRRGIELFLPEATGLELFTDRDRLRQILDNLVSNAITHTPEGGSVSITAQRVEGEARITVSDTGEGISSADLPYVFERFYRSPDVTHGAGLGLGLAISRELARAMGGDITAVSRGGEGSSFILTLPLGP